MKKIGDYIVYKKDVCMIKDVKLNFINEMDYYSLELIKDKSLTIDVPVNTKYIRDLITIKEIDKLIKDIPSIPIMDNDNRSIENKYKELLIHGEWFDLIKVIKISYMRMHDKMINRKKINETDEKYFNRAEKYLYYEIGAVLNMNFEDTKSYMIKKVQDIIDAM